MKVYIFLYNRVVKGDIILVYLHTKASVEGCFGKAVVGLAFRVS